MKLGAIRNSENINNRFPMRIGNRIHLANIRQKSSKPKPCELGTTTNQQGTFWAMNEQEGIYVLKCVHSYSCAREDISNPE